MHFLNIAILLAASSTPTLGFDLRAVFASPSGKGLALSGSVKVQAGVSASVKLDHASFKSERLSLSTKVDAALGVTTKVPGTMRIEKTEKIEATKSVGGGGGGNGGGNGGGGGDFSTKVDATLGVSTKVPGTVRVEKTEKVEVTKTVGGGNGGGGGGLSTKIDKSGGDSLSTKVLGTMKTQKTEKIEVTKSVGEAKPSCTTFFTTVTRVQTKGDGPWTSTALYLQPAVITTVITTYMTVTSLVTYSPTDTGGPRTKITTETVRQCVV